MSENVQGPACALNGGGCSAESADSCSTGKCSTKLRVTAIDEGYWLTLSKPEQEAMLDRFPGLTIKPLKRYEPAPPPAPTFPLPTPFRGHEELS